MAVAEPGEEVVVLLVGGGLVPRLQELAAREGKTMGQILGDAIDALEERNRLHGGG
jgi:hypothetical protein